MIYSCIVKQNYINLIQNFVLTCLLVVIFLNPFKDILNLTEICFYIALILAVVIFFVRKDKPDFQSPLGLPFLLFLLWALASIIWAVDRNNTLHDIYPRLVKLLALYYLLILFFNTRERFISLVRILIVSTTLFALGSLVYIYFIMGHPLSFPLEVDNVSPNHMGQICLFATLLSMIFVSTAEKWPERIALALCFISTLTAVLLSCSRSSFIALATGTFVLICFSQFKKSFLVGFSIILISIVLLSSISPLLQAKLLPSRFLQDGRIAIFATAYEMIKDRPLIGFGYGAKSFGDNMLKYKSRLPPELSAQANYRHTHNVFLDIATRLGLVGLGFFIFILFRVFKMGWELIKQRQDSFARKWGVGMTACLAALLTAGIFENILTRRIGVILYVIMAMITMLWKLHRSGEEIPS